MSIINFIMRKALFVSLMYSLLSLYPSIMQGMFLSGKAKERQDAMIKRMEQRKTEKPNLRLLPLKFGSLEQSKTRELATQLFGKDIQHERTISSQLKLGSFRPEEQQQFPVVWINTKNGTRSIEQWKIEQTDLKDLFFEQKGINSKDNPIQVRAISDKQLLLLSHAFDALINGTFITYLKDLQNESEAETGSRLLDLGLVVEKVGANKINRLLGLELGAGLESLSTEGPIKHIHSQISKLSLDKHLDAPKDIFSAGISNDGSTCVISDRNNKVWDISFVDMNTQTINKLCTASSKPEYCLLNKANSFICYYHSGGNPRLWDIDQKKEIALSFFRFSQFSPDGNCIIGFNIDRGILRYDIKTETTETLKDWTIFPAGQTRSRNVSSASLSWSSDGDFIVFAFATVETGGSFDPNQKDSSLEFYLFNIENKTYKQLFYDRNTDYARCRATVISPDNSKCAYLSGNHIIVYDIPAGVIVSQIERKDYFEKKDEFSKGIIAFNQDGTQCFVDQARYNCIITIDIASGNHSRIVLEKKQDESNAMVSHTVFSPDGLVLAVVKEPALLLYDSQTGALLSSIDIGDNVQEVAFTNDGNKLTVIRKNSIDTYNCHSSTKKININKEVNTYSAYLQKIVKTLIQRQSAEKSVMQQQSSATWRSRLSSYIKSWWS